MWVGGDECNPPSTNHRDLTSMRPGGGRYCFDCGHGSASLSSRRKVSALLLVMAGTPSRTFRRRSQLHEPGPDMRGEGGQRSRSCSCTRSRRTRTVFSPLGCTPCSEVSEEDAHREKGASHQWRQQRVVAVSAWTQLGALAHPTRPARTPGSAAIILLGTDRRIAAWVRDA